MDTECFNCATSASNRYTVIVEGSKVVEDVVMCDQCLAEFREEDWIKIQDAPALKRGGDTDQYESQ